MLQTQQRARKRPDRMSIVIMNTREKMKGGLMKSSMFCYQCQEAAKGVGCTIAGVCGKTAEVAHIQDVLLYAARELSRVTTALRSAHSEVPGQVDELVTSALFATITNANFDKTALEQRATNLIEVAHTLNSQLGESALELWDGSFDSDELARLAHVEAVENPDVRSVRELVTYGLKGLGAYAHHARVLGFSDAAIDTFLQQALAATSDITLTIDQLLALAMEVGSFGVKVMALLDSANTTRFGNPQATEVSLEVRSNPAILISGHDLSDLEQLLEQTQGTGVDVYTHCEMLPAHAYPAFKKYDNLVGNYGGAWWNQRSDIEHFHGPVLFTTNCIVPPRESYKARIFTTGCAGFEGCTHIEADEHGHKDFSQLIAMARLCSAPEPIESGSVMCGFAHNQVLSLADTVVSAIKSGAVRQFVVMAGCDGRSKQRSYYEDFAKALPQDTIILTAGCAKYRYNKLNLGTIGGIPRVLDAGQCNDCYSLVAVALKLQEVFGLSDINDLPIIYNIAWYEQKAVIVLLALLSLGVKNIHLGPTLPAFISPAVADVLVKNFGIASISSVEHDMKEFFCNDASDANSESAANGESSDDQVLITGDMLVGQILRMHEGAAAILEQAGMGCLGCPASQSESLAEAAMVHGLELAPILEKLNASAARPASR